MRRWNRQLVVALALALGLSGVAGAELQQSNNYSMNESEFGGMGDFSAASSGYRLGPGTDDGGATLGETITGNSSSTNYQSGGGFNTTAQPGLTFMVTSSSVDFGVMTSGTSATQTATFNVKNYTSYGYAVTIIGTPPTNSGHPLAPMGTQSANSTGCSPACASNAVAEQFGINLRANTSPSTVGSDPVPAPSSSFSLSDPNVVIPAPYRTANQYRFFSGDAIASAPRSSGETDYTISFLANISTTTPGGKYTGGLTLVATGTY